MRMNSSDANLFTLFGLNCFGKTRLLQEVEPRATCGQVLRIGTETLICPSNFFKI